MNGYKIVKKRLKMNNFLFENITIFAKVKKKKKIH